MHHLFAAMTPQFLANAVDRGLARARYKTGGEPSVPTPGKRSISKDDLDNFQRLVDSDNEGGNHRAVAESASDPSLHTKAGKPKSQMYMSDSSKANELSQVETGDGVMVKTEITVTTEEKIHDVIGF